MSPELVAASHRVLTERARSFYWASLLLPPALRDDVALIYAFCREVDDTADTIADPELARDGLDRLTAELQGAAPARPLVAAFLALAARVDLPIESARELIAGARSDLGEVRIADDAELVRYCYRVAATVGLMMCAVIGVRRRDALPHAVDLGIAMQMTNIARDVAEDAAQGRIYLPLVRLWAHGVEPAALLEGRADSEAVAAVISEVLDLAEPYYRSADGGMRDIPWRARQAILVASRIYRGIGVRLRRNGCDALAGRTVVPWPEKLLWGTRALAAGCTPAMLGLRPRAPHDPALHLPIRGLAGANR
jgi:15-cis-phytoene synthase